MAVTVLSGLVDDQDILSNQRVVDMNDVIQMLDPDVSQFTTILMKLASKPANSTKIEWLEDQYFPRVTTLAASATSAAGTISVASGTGAYFTQYDICRIVSTGEAVAVSAAPSTDTVGITRAIGGVAAASAASGGDIVILGRAAVQGATQGTKRITKKTNAYNYTQIVRNNYGFVKSLAASKLYGGPQPDAERRKKLVEHKRSMEDLCFFGARKYDTSTNTEPQGFVGGVWEFLTTNVKNPAGQVTKATFDGYLDAFFAHGSLNKVAFAAPLPSRIISTYSSVGMGSAYQPFKPDVFGANIKTFISGAYGYELPIIVKREWSNMASTTSGYGSWMFVIDLDNVKLRPLRSTKLNRDIQAPDADRDEEEYITEFSLEVNLEASHGVVEGMTS